MQKNILQGTLITALTFQLSACAFAPHTVSPAESGTYRLSAPKRSGGEASAQWRAMHEQAQAHCTSLGRSAVALEESAAEDAKSGERFYLRFACTVPAR